LAEATSGSTTSRNPGQNPLVLGELNSKAKGELAELAFSLKAASMGFGVAKPHGENERYDFIVDSGKRLWRVQVKSSYCIHRGAYRARCHRAQAKLYEANEIDFVAIYIVPVNIWYVIPANCVIGSIWVAFYPSGCKQGGRFEGYREAWHLMGARASSPSAESE
jgi:hypothetical protein